MKKRVLSGLLAVMVSAMLLVGCSQDGEKEETSTDANVSTEKDNDASTGEEKDSNERVKITYAQ